MNQKTLLLIFAGMAVLSLLVAALIPDIEAQDGQVTWQPNTLSTATATLTPTEGWYDDLPTPSYGKAAASVTPDLTQTPTASILVPTISPTLGVTDILITLTAESER
ncbi:MAG: hypothetical protein ISS57_06100 [Anaerolineales bacterium]|nr:hypothetical protein [Anaerolineales bacterium]